MITWIVIACSLLLSVTFCLPWIAKTLLNRKLTKLEGFTGHVERVKLRLLTGKIIICNLRLFTMEPSHPNEPLLQVPETTILFRWKSLLKRMLDLNFVLESPDVLIVTEQPAIPEKPTTSSNGLPGPKAVLERFMPFRLHAEVRNGKFRFINSGPKKRLELAMTEIHLTLSDLTNQRAITDSCSIKGSSKLYDGSLETNITLRPLESTLTLDLNLQLKSINLVLLNDLMRTYGKVDVNQGLLHLSAEVAVSNNAFKGYIKPILKELDFMGTSDQGDGVFQKIWERSVAVFVQLLENNRKDQIATTIPIEGRLDDPHVHVVAAIIGVLRNAFVKAFTPTLEDIIDIESIWKKTKLKTKGVFNSLFKKRNRS